MVQSKKLIALIATAGCLAPAAPWVRVRGEGYEIATDAGESVARRMAVRLEGMRELLGGVRKTWPLRALLIQDRALFDALRPGSRAPGFFHASSGEDWVAVAWGAGDSERVFSHELVHAFLEHSGPRRPLWLEEGLAEFYSTARLGAGHWSVGEPIAAHESLVRRQEWLDDELFTMEPAGGHSRQGLFYAQSWAVTHYLLSRPEGPRFFALMSDGMDAAAACRAAFGIPVPELLRRARERRAAPVRIGTDLAGASAPAVSAMSREDVEEMQVAIALAVGRPELARKLARSPAQLGLLALAAGDKTEATRLLRQAPRSAPVLYELAMLTNDDGLLEEAVRLQPAHAAARHLLGVRASVRGQTAKAIEHLQAAAEAKPRSAAILHSLALELERAGRREEARVAAVHCGMAARNQTEREMAAGLDRLTRAAPAAAEGRKPAVAIPLSWQGLKGDRAVDGVMVRFECGATPPEAHVETASGELLRLAVKQPGKIRITGGKHTFACGATRLPVRAEYVASTLELTAVEFR